MPAMTDKPPDVPATIQPYRSHGLVLARPTASGECVGDCPWCNRSRKFSVNVDSGLWKCIVCQEGTERGGGNVETFLELLWRKSDERTNGARDEHARDRKLLNVDTLIHWGVCQSVLTTDWLYPAHRADGKLCQLYIRRWNNTSKRPRWQLYPTSGVSHALHGVPLLNRDAGTIYLCEGPFDAMALWEALRGTKATDKGYSPTGSEAASMLADAAVLAVANCGAVGEPLRPYLSLFSGKIVVLCFDNDKAGRDAAERAVKLLMSGDAPPAEVRMIIWEDGLASGWDVRDELAIGEKWPSRSRQLGKIVERIKPVPAEWVSAAAEFGKQRLGSSSGVGVLGCNNYFDMVAAWDARKGGALRMRSDLFDVLSTMLAVGISTEQQGDQLFLQVIGSAGSAKTRLCDAMLTSKTCYPLEHLTGFHSGWKSGEGGDDYSLLARINRKCLITPEGDVLYSSPHFHELMSQQRRIFDGTSGASYKTLKEDRRYVGLRTPWIMAGTWQLLNSDQSRLGDRFLRVVIGDPGRDERREILRLVGRSAMDAVTVRSNCAPDSIVPEKMLRAYRLTGGYLEHLHSIFDGAIAEVRRATDDDWLMDQMSPLAEFVACLRARPDPDKRKEEKHDSKELPSRLMAQFIRLAMCSAVVLGKRVVDAEVVRRARKVALDSAKGRTLEVVRRLYNDGERGRTADSLALLGCRTLSAELDMLGFLQRIEVVEPFNRVSGEGAELPAWRLTPPMRSLFEEVAIAKAD